MRSHFTAAVGISLSTSAGKNLLAILDIVVTILVLAADMKADTVEQTSVALCIIDDYIMTRGKSIDRGNDSLISEVVEVSIFLLLELSEHFLQLLMVSGMLGILDKIAALKKKYNFRFLIDDAHGFGLLGEHGRGTSEALHCMDEVDLYIGAFAKSMASIGGFVAGPHKIINYLRANTQA